MLELFFLILAGHRAFVAAISLQSIGTLFINWNDSGNWTFRSITPFWKLLIVMLMFVWYKVCFVRPGGNLRWVSMRAKFGDTFKLFLCSCTCHGWNFVTTGNTQTHPILMKASDNFTSFTEQLLHFLCENEKGKGIGSHFWFYSFNRRRGRHHQNKTDPRYWLGEDEDSFSTIDIGKLSPFNLFHVL